MTVLRLANKLVLVGDSGVGKTCLVARWTRDLFAENHASTVGAAYVIRMFDFDGTKHKMEIWDTAGEEKFQSLTPIYSRGAMGALIVFDVTSRLSFDNVVTWKKVLANCDPDLPIVVVGNKQDKEGRCVEIAEGQQCAESISGEYCETSAATGYGVNEAFSIISEKAITHRIALETRGLDPPRPVENVEKGTNSNCC
jgi:Ras-related protein Rab-8A